MKKRLLAVLAAAVLGVSALVLPLSGCNSNTAYEGDYGLNIITLKKGYGTEWLEALADEMEEMYPGITIVIKTEVVDTNITNKLDAGEGYCEWDLFFGGTDFRSYIKTTMDGSNVVLADLSDIYANPASEEETIIVEDKLDDSLLSSFQNENAAGVIPEQFFIQEKRQNKRERRHTQIHEEVDERIDQALQDLGFRAERKFVEEQFEVAPCERPRIFVEEGQRKRTQIDVDVKNGKVRQRDRQQRIGEQIGLYLFLQLLFAERLFHGGFRGFVIFHNIPRLFVFFASDDESFLHVSPAFSLFLFSIILGHALPVKQARANLFTIFSLIYQISELICSFLDFSVKKS